MIHKRSTALERSLKYYGANPTLSSDVAQDTGLHERPLTYPFIILEHIYQDIKRR